MSFLAKVSEQFLAKHGKTPPVILATPLVCLILAAQGSKLTPPEGVKFFSTDLRDSDASSSSDLGIVLFARGKQIVASDLSESGSLRLGP